MSFQQRLDQFIGAIEKEFAVRIELSPDFRLPRLSGVFDQRIEDNLCMQVAAGLRTTLICHTDRMLRLVFLLNRTGMPKSTESLVRDDFRNRITRENWIGTCEIHGAGSSDSAGNEDALVLWIDDLTVPSPVPPQLLDTVVESDMRKPVSPNAVVSKPHPRPADKYMFEQVAARRAGAKATYWPAPNAPGKYEKAILFCLYWLDFGGAEAFALQSMRAAKQAGFRVYVVCDELGRHRMLEKAGGIADAVYLMGNFASKISWEELLLRVLRRHQPATLHIHHSWVAYRTLPVIRTLRMVAKVIDTTHILENRWDFPKESTLLSEYIDTHHVISNELVQFYRDAGVETKVSLGRLHELSSRFSAQSTKWNSRDPFRVAFVGRFSEQKRPILFMRLAYALIQKFGNSRFRFTAVGEGELRLQAEQYASVNGMRDAVEFLPGSAAVTEVMARSHVLVLCSDNEGLALVAFEAMRSDCLVISCDVGAQSELVPIDMLVDAEPTRCVSEIADLIAAMATGKLTYEDRLEAQRRKLEQIVSEQSGTEICLEFYASSQ